MLFDPAHLLVFESDYVRSNYCCLSGVTFSYRCHCKFHHNTEGAYAPAHGEVVAVLPVDVELMGAVQKAYTMLDDDGNGVLDKNDFTHNPSLWLEIKKKLDTDHSNSIDVQEYRACF
jgi:hypothetical protein